MGWLQSRQSPLRHRRRLRRPSPRRALLKRPLPLEPRSASAPQRALQQPWRLPRLRSASPPRPRAALPQEARSRSRCQLRPRLRPLGPRRAGLAPRLVQRRRRLLRLPVASAVAVGLVAASAAASLRLRRPSPLLRAASPLAAAAVLPRSRLPPRPHPRLRAASPLVHLRPHLHRPPRPRPPPRAALPSAVALRRRRRPRSVARRHRQRHSVAVAVQRRPRSAAARRRVAAGSSLLRLRRAAAASRSPALPRRRVPLLQRSAAPTPGSSRRITCRCARLRTLPRSRA